MVQVNKRGLSTDTDELDSSQRLVNESMVTKRRRKQKYDDAQGNPEGKTELPEKEVTLCIIESLYCKYLPAAFGSLCWYFVLLKSFLYEKAIVLYAMIKR